MHLVVIGLNHTTAPVEIRERLCLPESDPRGFFDRLRESGRVREAVLLSTCNRTEVYAWLQKRGQTPFLQADGASADVTTKKVSVPFFDDVIEAIADHRGLPRDSFEPHLYSLSGHKAIEHLFRVASGIDSMILGEAQVLGQVKSAYASASEAEATGPVLNALFQQAISVGKRARTETEIGRGAFSVGYAAVQLARSIFDPLKGRTVLIIGAGKMGELTATHLASAGVTSVLVANRTYERAVDLAERFGGSALRFDELQSALRRSDIVITSTAAGKPIVTREMVSQVMRVRRGRPVFIIDVAVPRDVEPEVGDLDDVFLYNIDDLQAVVAAAAEERDAEIAKVEAIIRAEVAKSMDWFRTLDAVPVITALRDKFEEIRQSELEKLRARLPNMSEEEIEAVSQTTRSIVNKICHQPMIRIKEYAADEVSIRLDTICDAFGICPTEKEADQDV